MKKEQRSCTENAAIACAVCTDPDRRIGPGKSLAKARTPGRSESTKGFSRVNRDLYPKHALKTSYITRSTSCVTRGLSRTSATLTIGRPDEQLLTDWRGSSKNWGRSWTSDAAIFMYHTSQVGLRSSQRFGIG